MTALPAAYLGKAAQSLREARAVAEIGYYEAAGRAAYLAAFHTAQALVLARTDKVAKTHSGLRSEFSRLVKEDPVMERGLTAFLARAYNLKVAADYAVGADEEVGKSEAAEAIDSATRFVAAVERALSRR